MNIEKLKVIGLNEKESKVYLALLELEDALVSEISEKTKINRSLLYSILTGMANKGTVTYILKNNMRYYRAVEPQKLLSLMKEKEKTLTEMLPELIALHKPRAKKPIVEILEGREGLKTVLNDVIRVKKEWCAFNVPGKGPEILGPLVHVFENERVKAGIQLNAIMMRSPQARERAKSFAKMKHTKIRYMPKAYESPASSWIYGDRVAIVFWYKEFPFAIRIIDNDLAESYKNHFKLLWAASEEK